MLIKLRVICILLAASCVAWPALCLLSRSCLFQVDLTSWSGCGTAGGASAFGGSAGESGHALKKVLCHLVALHANSVSTFLCLALACSMQKCFSSCRSLCYLIYVAHPSSVPVPSLCSSVCLSLSLSLSLCLFVSSCSLLC